MLRDFQKCCKTSSDSLIQGMQGMCVEINDLGNYHYRSVYRRQGWPAPRTVPDDPEVEAEYVDRNASLGQVYGDQVSINVRRRNIIADNKRN
jgi:hypothetical protein